MEDIPKREREGGDNKLEGGRWGGLEDIFSYFRNIQFARLRISFCIWAIAVLIKCLPAVQQGNKIGESELLQGQTEKLKRSEQNVNV